MSQNISTHSEVKHTYWVINLKDIHGPLISVYENDLEGRPNHIYLERSIATNLLMQDDENFPIFNRVYWGLHPLVDQYVIPLHDINVYDGYPNHSPEPEQHTPLPVVQSQDEYFADVDKMLAEADKLLSEIAVWDDELDVAAILAEPHDDFKEGEIRDNPQLKMPVEPSASGSSNPSNIILDGDIDVQQLIERGFKCVTYNVQKSRKNVHYFLEKHMEDVNIAFIQEPLWEFTKKVLLSKNKEGDNYKQTVSHRKFILIGVAKENRVTTYIYKKWKHLAPKLNMSVVNHPNIQCVELSMLNGDIVRFLNVYNDSKQFKALEYLEQRFNTMSDIHVMTGDFNLHHSIWDTKVDFAGH